MIEKEKNAPGKGELCFHKKRRELVAQLEALGSESSPTSQMIATQLDEQVSRLPSYVGQVTTPDGQCWSMALYPDDTSAIGKIRVSIRPWKEKNEPLQ